MVLSLNVLHVSRTFEDSLSIKSYNIPNNGCYQSLLGPVNIAGATFFFFQLLIRNFIDYLQKFPACDLC